jgi:hypothetical protein
LRRAGESTPLSRPARVCPRHHDCWITPQGRGTTVTPPQAPQNRWPALPQDHLTSRMPPTPRHEHPCRSRTVRTPCAHPLWHAPAPTPSASAPLQCLALSGGRAASQTTQPLVYE